MKTKCPLCRLENTSHNIKICAKHQKELLKKLKL